jgi:hypothetical protein
VDNGIVTPDDPDRTNDETRFQDAERWCQGLKPSLGPPLIAASLEEEGVCCFFIMTARRPPDHIIRGYHYTATPAKQGSTRLKIPDSICTGFLYTQAKGAGNALIGFGSNHPSRA